MCHEGYREIALRNDGKKNQKSQAVSDRATLGPVFVATGFQPCHCNESW